MIPLLFLCVQYVALIASRVQVLRCVLNAGHQALRPWDLWPELTPAGVSYQRTPCLSNPELVGIK